MEKFSSLLRTHNWWSCKMPLFLGIGYASAERFGWPVLALAGWLLVLLAAVVSGAVFVSVLNDSTDLAADNACGKRNVFNNLPALYRWLIPVAALGLSIVFLIILLPDTLSVSLYLAAIISFCLYSVKPFRFKAKGILGVLCDAFGAHLFPGLLIVTSCSYFFGQPVNWVWFCAVGAWSFCFGLRGILFHQFADRQSDLKAGVRTFATKINPSQFRSAELAIVAIELAVFSFVLVEVNNLLLCLALAGYLVLLFTRARKLQLEVVVIRVSSTKGTLLLMNTFYQAYFPVCLLISAALAHPANFLVLGVHLMLFPQNLLLLFNDGKLVLKKGLKLLHLEVR